MQICMDPISNATFLIISNFHRVRAQTEAPIERDKWATPPPTLECCRNSVRRRHDYIVEKRKRYFKQQLNGFQCTSRLKNI